MSENKLESPIMARIKRIIAGRLLVVIGVSAVVGFFVLISVMMILTFGFNEIVVYTEVVMIEDIQTRNKAVPKGFFGAATETEYVIETNSTKYPVITTTKSYAAILDIGDIIRVSYNRAGRTLTIELVK